MARGRSAWTPSSCFGGLPGGARRDDAEMRTPRVLESPHGELAKAFQTARRAP